MAPDVCEEISKSAENPSLRAFPRSNERIIRRIMERASLSLNVTPILKERYRIIFILLLASYLDLIFLSFNGIGNEITFTLLLRFRDLL